jgi:hypothetical protein
VFLVLVFCSVLCLCRSPIPPSQITNRSTTLIGLPSLAGLRELSLHQPYIHCETLFEPFHPLDQPLPSQTVSFCLTRLPIVATDSNTTTADTHVDGDPFTEDPGVDNDEHSELPDPPPRQRRLFN